MITYPNYVFQLTHEELIKYWPILEENVNFHFSSWSKRNKKCIWYALMLDRGNIDMLWFRDFYGLDSDTLNHSAKGYADIFQKYYQFEYCDTAEYIEGYITIILYEDKNGDFKHVARVLSNGNFTSKIGNYEDIEHYTLEALSGNEYGYPKLFMRKKVDFLADNFIASYNPYSHK